MRRTNPLISACLAILAFASAINAFETQHNQDIPDHTTPSTIQNINIEINGPVNIYPWPDPRELRDHYHVQQPDIVSCGGWYFTGALIFMFSFLLWPRHHPEQKSVDIKGRTPAIVSGRVCVIGDADHLHDVAEGVNSAPLLRGKQPATQGLSEGPRPSSPPPWVTENPSYVQTSDKSGGVGVAQCVVRSSVVDQEEKIHVHQEPPSLVQPGLQEPVPNKRGPGAPVASSSSPLKGSLRGQNRWFILIIAVNYNGITDPENDLKVWITTLRDSTHQRVVLKGLAGAKATLKAIESELASLYSQAWMAQGISQPNLLIYLTGEGNKTGGMYLSDGSCISGKNFELWLQKLQEGRRLDRAPAVLFDMCRYDADSNESIVELGAYMNLIYSCFPGEGALAMSFGRSETLLSAFALAFVMASCNSPHPLRDRHNEASSTNAGLFKEAVQMHLDQLTNVVNLFRRSGSGQPKNHIFARTLSRVRAVFWSRSLELAAQSPDWRQAGDLELIFDLANMLSNMGEARETHRFIVNHKYFREANSQPVPASDYGPKLKDHTGQHNRGANKNVPPAGLREIRDPAGMEWVTTSS